MTAHVVVPASGSAPAGDRGEADRQADAFWGALLRTGYGPLWVLREERELPVEGTPRNGSATILELCRGTACFAPLDDPAQVAGAVRTGQD